MRLHGSLSTNHNTAKPRECRPAVYDTFRSEQGPCDVLSPRGGALRRHLRCRITLLRADARTPRHAGLPFARSAVAVIALASGSGHHPRRKTCEGSESRCSWPASGWRRSPRRRSRPTPLLPTRRGTSRAWVARSPRHAKRGRQAIWTRRSGCAVSRSSPSIAARSQRTTPMPTASRPRHRNDEAAVRGQSARLRAPRAGAEQRHAAHQHLSRLRAG